MWTSGPPPVLSATGSVVGWMALPWVGAHMLRGTRVWLVPPWSLRRACGLVGLHVSLRPAQVTVKPAAPVQVVYWRYVALIWGET